MSLSITCSHVYYARIQRGGGGKWSGHPPPLKNHKAIGYLSNTSPDPLENQKATKPAFNVGPSSAGQCTVSFLLAGHDGPLIVVFGSSLHPSTKKIARVGPPLTKKLLDPRVCPVVLLEVCCTATVDTLIMPLLKYMYSGKRYAFSHVDT